MKEKLLYEIKKKKSNLSSKSFNFKFSFKSKISLIKLKTVFDSLFKTQVIKRLALNGDHLDDDEQLQRAKGIYCVHYVNSYRK